MVTQKYSSMTIPNNSLQNSFGVKIIRATLVCSQANSVIVKVSIESPNTIIGIVYFFFFSFPSVSYFASRIVRWTDILSLAVSVRQCRDHKRLILWRWVNLT